MDSGQPKTDWHREKEESICYGCPKFDSKPADGGEPDADIDPEEIDEIVDDIEDIAFLERGGQPTDWSEYCYEYYVLFAWWRAAEREIEQDRARRLDALVKGFMK